jgi:hypothetical protein
MFCVGEHICGWFDCSAKCYLSAAYYDAPHLGSSLLAPRDTVTEYVAVPQGAGGTATPSCYVLWGLRITILVGVLAHIPFPCACDTLFSYRVPTSSLIMQC